MGSRLVVARDLEKEKQGMTADGYHLGVMKILWICVVLMVAQLCEFTEQYYTL